MVIIAKDEEKSIERTLESLRFAAEIIVIDDTSNDRTVAIAKKHNATVYSHMFSNDFSAQRNFGLKKSKSEWVLFIDADEIVSDDLKDEILKAVDGNYDGFFLKRTDTIWGRTLRFGETGNMRLLRLGKKNKGRWHGKVHEVWDIHGNIGVLRAPLFHFPHPSIEEFIRKINYYSDIRADELYERREGVSVLHVMFYPAGKFFLNFIVRLGFLDGMRGLMHAIAMSMHSYLVRAKLWLRHHAEA